MSKTYILEPVELEFDGSRSANLDSFIPEETLAKIDRQYVFELSDGTILKFWEYYSISTEYYFTINGDPIDWDYYDQHQEETMPVYAVISDRPSLPGGPIDTTKIFCPLPGTYTVSIYTETEDEDAKPYIDEKLSKNVTYTDHPHNNWEEVLSKKGDPKTGYNTIEKLASSTSEGGSGDSDSSGGDDGSSNGITILNSTMSVVKGQAKFKVGPFENFEECTSFLRDLSLKQAVVIAQYEDTVYTLPVVAVHVDDALVWFTCLAQFSSDGTVEPLNFNLDTDSSDGLMYFMASAYL